ncbi:MAG: shikimate dehydrogenase [Candidatus Poribacteria bacterium]|nr:shikimate dehydrogenase [Candidatus Poribacteria bacterium]
MDNPHTITGHTRIVGVIGEPVAHSRSPQMHNAALAKASLDFIYVPFHVPVDAVADAITGFKAINVVGINVTLPHKQSVMPFLTSISREAELIGAVNTLTFTNGKIHGENTDAPGFLRALEETGASIPVGEDVVVLGAGGSARAIVVALALAGVRSVIIANRTVSKAVALAEELTKKIGLQIDEDNSLQESESDKDIKDNNITVLEGMGLEDSRLKDAVISCSLLVNTSTSSMDSSHPLLIDPNWLQPSTTVYDIVYTPPMTSLLSAAADKQCPIVGGLGMLVHQGAIAFERWTGVIPCVDTMREALS